MLLASVVFAMLINAVAGTPAPSARLSPKCMYPVSVAQHLAWSEVVFSGRVIEIRKDGEGEEVRLRVFKSWKNVRSAEVTLTNDPESEAGTRYQVGESYLVFANGSQEKPSTGACSHVPVLRYASKEMKELNRLLVRHKKNRS